jgi:hypothetical protein
MSVAEVAGRDLCCRGLLLVLGTIVGPSVDSSAGDDLGLHPGSSSARAGALRINN